MSVGMIVPKGGRAYNTPSAGAQISLIPPKGRGYFSIGSANGILMPRQMGFFTTAILQLLRWRVAGAAL